ncbi:right-handed parallel beta-helix repeat-containing protein [Glaciecola siphonariae]|uniref:Right-handed parallel beta-helix repeat-containing protein n=1 Tax=Glaciecola siphonariae TaxID=521012 RepID=A0ABV9LVC4_9ALTE
MQKVNAHVRRLLLGLGACILLCVLLATFLLNSDEARAFLSPSLIDSFSSQGSSVKTPTTVLKKFMSEQLPVPDDFYIERVDSSKSLLAALANANKRGGSTAIYLHDGEYHINQTLRVLSDNIMLLSVSQNPYTTIIRSRGMRRTSGVQNVLEVRASGFVLDGITLSDAPNHLIQIAAENQASKPIIRNCILQDSFEQLLKVSYDQASRPNNISHDGLVEHCIFQYTRGIAPYYYTGGIDALGAKGWRVQNNIFKDIASPGGRIAQHAVHFWINASDNKVTNNIFIDNDRSIGFGMKLKNRDTDTLEYFSEGGVISGNVIYHTNNGDPFADTGIILEASPNTRVENNYVFMQHSYRNAIEYRFKETRNAVIKDNFTNRAIRSRNGGNARLIDNSDDLDSLVFFDQLERIIRDHHIEHLAHPMKGSDKHD